MSGCAAVALVVAVAACSNSATSDSTERDSDGVVTEGGDVGAFRLRLGDCVDDDVEGDVEVVRVVPCEQSHVAEVFHVFDIALDDFPGQASVNSAADDTCLAQFAGYVGAAYGTSEFGVGYIAPTEGTWNQLDDREVLCTLFRVDGAPKAGSARGSGR